MLTADQAYDRNRLDEFRSKGLIVRRDAAVVSSLKKEELRRLAGYLGVPLSTTELGKTTNKSVDQLAKEIMQEWEAEKHILGDIIAVPPPPEKRGAKAKSWRAIAKL